MMASVLVPPPDSTISVGSALLFGVSSAVLFGVSSAVLFVIGFAMLAMDGFFKRWCGHGGCLSFGWIGCGCVERRV